jgi:undecaprenyl-diphosphatase
MTLFMKFIATKSFMPFVWYRIALGVVLIALVSAGFLSPDAGDPAH